MSSSPYGRRLWWLHPDRPCKGDVRYTTIKGVSKSEREEMVRDCLTCPVYFECLDDLLLMDLRDHYGIRAAIKGKT